jgi:ubiquinone/menaquinone biosynthesis C-methylase UbiE
VKSPTDKYWSDRALTVADDADVNITDVYQRELELDAIAGYLEPAMRVLEAGCGNGFSTARLREIVAHVDGFDYSEEMIARAKSRYGERNNRFIRDNVLEPRAIDGRYDAVLCTRVLINLRDLDEQRRALRALEGFVAPSGRLIVTEGFSDGFAELSALRAEVGLPPVEPAGINCYSPVRDVLAVLDPHWRVAQSFHLGMYDYLTRVVYPMIVGPDMVRHNTAVSERSVRLARRCNPESMAPLSRVRGFVLERTGGG